MTPPTGAAPSVGVVVATHNRPQLMKRALDSILAQEYAGQIDVVLVFDRSEPDLSLARTEPGRSVRVLANDRTPGLAGARNTGILSLDTVLVAFCDDDDMWLPGKLAAQVEELQARPGTQFVTTAMRVDYKGEESVVRLAERREITFADLTRSRMTALHSSSFLFERAAMVDGFGLVDETIPRSMGEDWDLLLRAARQHPIAHIDRPLVGIQWGGTSYFNDAWRDKNAAHEWLIERHPEIKADKVGAALMYGKLAFGHAELGERRAAWRYARMGARTNWREPRSYIALLVIAGVPGGSIQKLLNKRGYGI